jgi:hypothetical protein
MRYDLIGSVLLFISALLHAARHIATGCCMAGRDRFDLSAYRAAYRYVGRDITTWAVTALILGIICLGYGVYRDLRKR